MRPQQFVSVYLNEDVASSGGAPTPIFTEARFRARKASPVTVTNGGGTSIVWDTIIEQLNMSFNPGNGTVTATEAGIYLISAAIGWQFNASATQSVSLSIIGSSGTLSFIGSPPLASPFPTNLSQTIQVRLAIGDSVQIFASHSNAAALSRDFGQFPAPATLATSVSIEKLAN